MYEVLCSSHLKPPCPFFPPLWSHGLKENKMKHWQNETYFERKKEKRKLTLKCCCEFIMVPDTCTNSLARRVPVKFETPPGALIYILSRKPLDSVGNKGSRESWKNNTRIHGRLAVRWAKNDESFGDVSTPLDLLLCEQKRGVREGFSAGLLFSQPEKIIPPLLSVQLTAALLARASSVCFQRPANQKRRPTLNALLFSFFLIQSAVCLLHLRRPAGLLTNSNLIQKQQRAANNTSSSNRLLMLAWARHYGKFS